MGFYDKLIYRIELFRQAYGAYKRQIIILTVLGFLSGLLEAIGVNAIIPLFSSAIGNLDLGQDFISQAIAKFFHFFHINYSVLYLLVFIISLFILKAIAQVVCAYINIKIFSDYEENTRRHLLKSTLDASWPYLINQKVGHLETVLMNDVQNSTALLQQISGIIMGCTSLFMYVVIAINISLTITLTTLVLGGILFFFFRPLVLKVRQFAGRMVEINKQVAHYVNENIIGAKTVKSMLITDPVLKVGDDYFEQLKQFKIKIYLYQNFSTFILPPISLIFICVVFFISYQRSGFNFAALIAVVYLIQKIFQYIQQLETNLHSASGSIPYLISVLSFEHESVKNKENISGSRPFEFKEQLEFNRVGFSYDSKKDVLGGVSFHIKKGELIGLIGPSGAGKTTIVDLMLRLYNPRAGEILMDSVNIGEINLKEWRDNIGYVSQDIFLINDTIANNIKFYDNSISDEDMLQAAKMANIFDFIQDCPNKFSTVIGERGIMLSAGQRQRIIIARVLARKPKLLILDEATSALDNESELKIQKVIEDLRGKITVFVIAHRLSTIINSDRLIVLENGKIIEKGIPVDLLNDKESYFYKVYHIRNS